MGLAPFAAPTARAAFGEPTFLAMTPELTFASVEIALAKKSPMESVLRMAFTGRHERMPAHRARELGIVSEVVDPPGLLREVAQELAERIAQQPPEHLAAVKRALWDALEKTP